MANHICVLDQDGSLLWEGSSSAPFLGLQAGETFWFGSLENRTWSSILSISYGIDTDTGDFHVELIVQKAGPKPTKTFNKRRKLIDHGEKSVKDEAGGMISIDGGRLVVTVGKIFTTSSVRQLTIQLNTPYGPMINTETDVEVGSSVRVEDSERLVIATLTFASYSTPAGARVRITEHVVED